jgi:hypothetical protein
MLHNVNCGYFRPGAVPQGAMTYSFLKIMTTTPRITYRQILLHMREIIKANVKRFVQVVMLQVSIAFCNF